MGIYFTAGVDGKCYAGINLYAVEDNIGQVVGPNRIGCNYLVIQETGVLPVSLQLNKTVIAVIIYQNAVADDKREVS